MSILKVLPIFLHLLIVSLLAASCITPKKNSHREPASDEKRELGPKPILQFFKDYNIKFDDPDRMYPAFPENIGEEQIVDKFHLENDPRGKKWVHKILGYGLFYGRDRETMEREPKLKTNISSVKTPLGRYKLIKNRVYFKRHDERNLSFVTPFKNDLFFQTESFPVDLWTGNWEFYADDTYPAKPNCDEKNFSSQDIIALFNKKDINSTYDLLEALPKDSLQKFTFIHKSQSLQNEGASKTLPRIMRYSTDGSLALTYTCASQAIDYNTIEIMEYSEAEDKYNFLHLSFPHKEHPEADIFNRLGKKSISHNHGSCLGCHGGSDPRPNWDPYPKWPGTYGSGEDYMTQKKADEYIRLKSIFQNFSCFQTLPWSKRALEDPTSVYPYIRTHKEANYNYRPNAHFTIAQSRRNAGRLTRKFRQHPLWSTIKYDVMKEMLSCQNYSITNNLPEYLQVRLVDNKNGFENFYPFNLMRVSQKLGFYLSDWDMRFNKGGPVRFGNIESYNENYEKYYFSGSWFPQDTVVSVLFRKMSEEAPELKPYDTRYNRMTQQFGRKFMCVDEIADKLFLSDIERKEVCDILDQKSPYKTSGVIPLRTNINYFETRAGAPPRRRVTTEESTNPLIGRSLVESICLRCHASILKYNFIDDSMIRKQMTHIGFKSYYENIEKQLGTPESCDMPYSMAGACLSDNERTSVLTYIKSLMP